MTGAAEPEAVVERPDSVTQFICPDTSAEGEAVTHHLHTEKRGGGNILACRYCGRTEKQLRVEVGLA